MKTNEIRKIIARELKREKQTNELTQALTLRFGEMGRTFVSAEIKGLVTFTQTYVKDVPLIIEEVERVSKKEGWYDSVSPILDAATQYFVEETDLIPDKTGLRGLADDAYFARTLLQRLSDLLKARTGKSFPVIDTKGANLVLREVVGEDTASILESRVEIMLNRLTSKDLFFRRQFSAIASSSAGARTSIQGIDAEPTDRFIVRSNIFDDVASRADGMPEMPPHPPAESRQLPVSADAADHGPSPVLLGASAPMIVKPGGVFTARFVAYIEKLEEEVRDLLKLLSPLSRTILGISECQWSTGTQVTVYPRSRHLVISPTSRMFTWSGTRNILDFDVEVPENAGEGTDVLAFDVAIGDFRVAELRLDMQISLQPSSEERSSSRTGVARTAFASYSVKDRARVLDRISSLSTGAGLTVFLDCLSLSANDVFKPALETEIRNRDLFLLFWSRSALESQWVRWELETALKAKGPEAVQMHILEPDLEPPPELKDRHAGDRYMWIRKAITDS